MLKVRARMLVVWGAWTALAPVFVNRSTSPRIPPLIGWPCLAIALLAFWPGAASASITITLPSLSVPESSSTQTGTFDVYVAASGNSLPEVSDFTVNLQVSPASGVEFIGGAATTDIPYIFGTQTNGPRVQFFNDNTTIEGADFASSPPTLVNDDGLLSVEYSIAADTSGTFNLTLVTTGDSPTALHDQNVDPIPFTVQNATLTVVPSTVYWNGGLDSSWNTLSGSSYATNWSTTPSGFTDAHALPGATTDVDFTTSGGGSNLNTTLSANLSIKGLTFTSAATSPVSISGNTLTIGSDGLTVQSGAAAPTINSGVTLSSSQTWMIAGSNPLTLGGELSFAGEKLTKSGSGTVRVDAAPSLASGSSLVVSAGIVQFNNTSAATVGSNVTATVSPAATLQLAGSAPALSQGSNLATITNNGSIASGGGLLVTGTKQTVGMISGQPTTSGGVTTYGGDTVVGTGITGSNLAATQILQNSLIINAGSTVTILPSGSVGISTASSANSASGSSVADSDSSAIATGGPIQTAIASVSPTSSSAASIAGSDDAPPSLLLPVGMATAGESEAAASSGAAPLDAENAAISFPTPDSLGLSASSLSDAPTIALGAPAVANSNSVPEPSSLVLLLLASAISLMLVMRRVPT